VKKKGERAGGKENRTACQREGNAITLRNPPAPGKILWKEAGPSGKGLIALTQREKRGGVDRIVRRKKGMPHMPQKKAKFDLRGKV